MAKPNAAIPTRGINAEPEAAQRRAALARLHVVKKERAIDDDDWRDVMERVTGRRSLKELDVRQLYHLLDELHGTPRGCGVGNQSASNKDGAPRAVGGSGVVGPYAGKLRAMWLSGWHLGVIRDRSDAALVAFVKRQTGLDAVRFLREAKAAAAAIEALKGWLARAAGVEWASDPDNPRAAVVDAQWQIARHLKAIGAHVPASSWDDARYQYARTVTGKTSDRDYTEEDWDRLIAALGARIRAVQAATGPTGL